VAGDWFSVVCLAITSYIVGHIIAAVSSLIIERGLLRYVFD
jgi:hypothetical protein